MFEAASQELYGLRRIRQSFLNQNGVHDVVQRDLAIELLNDLCTWEKTKPLYERIIRELNELLVYNRDLAEELHQQDRVHTYGSFYIADVAA